MPATHLTADEQAEFAQMHTSVLPGSLVARLGPSYTRSFYRYIDGSDSELVLAHRKEGRIVAGCVISLDPDSLSKRLMQNTPVLRSALLAAGRIPWLRMAAGSLPGGHEQGPPAVPEILLIFSRPEAQGQGYGKQLVRAAEQLVAERGHTGLRVKTLADPKNQAISFYERCGFQRWGTVSSLGKRLLVFSKAASLTG